MGIIKLIFGEEVEKELKTPPVSRVVDAKQEPFTPARPKAAQASTPSSHTSFIFKLSLLLIPLLLYGGYYWYQSTQASTTINTTLNENTDLSTGLVAHYTFDGSDMLLSSSSREVLDVSGNGNHGNWMNHATTTVIGKIGQAIQVDAVDDYVDVSVVLSTTTYTISLWIYPTNSDDYGSLFAESQFKGFYYRGGVTNTNKVSFYHSSGDNHNNTAMRPNTWNMVTLVNNGGNARIYLNGVVDSGVLTSAPAMTIEYIGNDTTNEAFGGRIDDFRTYNRALSASDIKRLYEMGATTHINTTIADGPLQEGLLGYWTFNGSDLNWSSTTAEVLDASGNNFHGDATNFNHTAAALGKLGQGLQFDGTDDRIVVADNDSLEGMANLTVSAWIYQTGNGGGGLGRVLEKSTEYGLLYSGAGSNRWTGRINGVDADTATISNLFNRWHHLVMVYNGTTITMYVDGVVSGTPAAQTGNVGTNTTALTLANTTGSRTFQGIIDDVRMYNRALSAQEVQDIYQIGSKTYTNTTIDTNDDLENGLVGHWTFDGPKMAWGSTTAEVLDSSVSSIEGDATNMDTSSVAIGKIGQALRFNGSNNHIALGAPSALTFSSTTPHTFSAWAKTTYPFASAQKVQYIVAVGSSAGGGTETYLGLVNDNGGAGRYNVRFGFGSVGQINSTNDIKNKLDNWYHVVGVWDGTTGYIYIDGVLNTSGALSPMTNLGSSAYIGTDDSGTRFQGTIDDVRIYNRALSAAEVRRLYELGGGR